MIDRVVEAEITVQPDDAAFARLDLGVAVIVRFEMSVRERVRVVGVRFMHVLRRDGGQTHHTRHKRQNERQTAGGTHEALIMVGGRPSGQSWRLPPLV